MPYSFYHSSLLFTENYSFRATKGERNVKGGKKNEKTVRHDNCRALQFFHSSFSLSHCSNSSMSYCVRTGSILAQAKKICSDLPWSAVCQHAFPYYIAQGKSGRSLCRACGYHFQKEELRIRTTLLRKVSQNVIMPCEINLCAKLRCIKLQPSSNFVNQYKSWVRDPYGAINR